MRTAYVYQKDLYAGTLIERGGIYLFQYDQKYLQNPNAIPVSLTLPLQAKPYQSERLFSFFLGLLPEGYLLGLSHQILGSHATDRFSLLLAVGHDLMGSVSVEKEPLSL
jgi:serine/threonine-protein kinase HipA